MQADNLVSKIERELAFDLRASWQSRALAAARGKTAAVLLSVLAHSLDDAMLPLLQVTFPGFASITAPFFCTAAKVAKGGQIVADMVTKSGRIEKDFPVYINDVELRGDFRRLADHLRLNDTDREEMFKFVQRWVVADRRLDPTFDPQDPDAKRLIH